MIVKVERLVNTVVLKKMAKLFAAQLAYLVSAAFLLFLIFVYSSHTHFLLFYELSGWLQLFFVLVAMVLAYWLPAWILLNIPRPQLKFFLAELGLVGVVMIAALAFWGTYHSLFSVPQLLVEWGILCFVSIFLLPRLVRWIYQQIQNG